MRELEKQDLYWCLRCLPKRVIKFMKDFGEEVMLAGGYIRSKIANESVNDIDLFVRSADKALWLSKSLQEGTDARVTRTDNAYTIVFHKFVVQVIHRWVYEEPESIIPSFDFTIARAVIWYDKVKEEWHSVCDDRFYSDLAAKRLIYCSPIRDEEAGGSLLRVLKFYQKGYRIPLDSFAAVISRLLSSVHEDGVRAMADTGIGEEKARTKIITGLLHEVDPQIDPEHIAHLPSSDSEESEA
jgi:hypothetical protein